MNEIGKWNFLCTLCILIIAAASIGLIALLRKMTIELVHPSPWKLKSHWWRFLLPSVVALIMMFSASYSMTILNHALWVLLLGVALPLWLIYSTLQEVLEKRPERIVGIVALLLLMNTAFLTMQYTKAQKSQRELYSGPAQIVDYYSSGSYEQNTMKLQLEWACSSSSGQEYNCHDEVVLDCNSDLSPTELRNSRDYDMTIYNGDSFLGCQDGFDRDVWQQYNWNRWNDDNGNANGNANDNGNENGNENENDNGNEEDRRLEDNNEGEENEGENGDNEEENRDEEEDNNEGEEENEEDNKDEEENEDHEENNNGQNDDAYQRNNRPYMMVNGNCNTCELDEHSGGNLNKAVRNRLVIPFWILTGIAALAFFSLMLVRRPRRTEVNAEKTAQLFDNGAAHRFEKDAPDRCMA